MIPTAPTRAPPEVLLHLRRATSARHDQIESLLNLDRLADRARLIAVLQVFDAFLADWEPRIARALPAPVRPWFERHRRGAWAEQDLAVLGARRWPAAPSPEIVIDSCAEALGSLYVLEGSALGGRIIARSLHDRLGIDDASGARFFGGRGAQTGRIWREFGEHAGARVTDPPSIARACEASDMTFAALIRHFAAGLGTTAA